jgi:hypothetical protein
MDFIRVHPLSFALVGIVVTAAAAVFAVARPTDHSDVVPAPPNNDLPYAAVSFDVTDAKQAFTPENVDLSIQSKTGTVTTLGSADDLLEVDVFGDPDPVKRSGFYDYTIKNGRYVHFPTSCGAGASTAERWHGNVRVILNCSGAGSDASNWLQTVDRALARL